jgi:hypothetical protein
VPGAFAREQDINNLTGIVLRSCIAEENYQANRSFNVIADLTAIIGFTGYLGLAIVFVL